MTNVDSYIGKQIGNYRIIAALNSGAYGSVYTGKHLIFEDTPTVAIKVLHAHLASSKEREEFIQEAQLLKKLKHPHILPILDANIQDGILFLVAEYASRGSLRERLNQQPCQPLSLEEAISILIQISQALYYAHQQNIVHRDLKPENILFNARGEALLADFGAATILASARTQQIDQIGTPAYMAPEQFEGIVSKKSDQYALGCIAYELVTGRQPFTIPTPSIEAMWYQHAKIQPTVPTQFNPSLPKHIEQAILKALAKQRTDRHADISVFLDALRNPAEPRTDEHEEALAACEQAIRLDPNNATAYSNKGIALYELKRYEEALTAYEQAIRFDPDDAIIHKGKVKALYSLKHYEEALTTYKKMMQLDPNYIYTYDDLLELLGIEKATAQSPEIVQTATPNRFSTFTKQAKRVLGLAQEEAQRFQHTDINTEHLLLGLIGEGEGITTKVLSNLGVEVQNIRGAIESYIRKANRPLPGEVGLTSHAKKVIELAADEARSLHHNYIGPEHLLLGLVRDDTGIAAGILESLGVYLERARIETLQVLNQQITNSIRLKLCEEVLATYEHALQFAPQDASLYKKKGDVLRDLKRTTEAALAYEKARQLSNTSCLIEVVVESVRINLATQQRVVILKDAKQERYLFIWIAHPGAYAIASLLQGTTSTIPDTAHPPDEALPQGKRKLQHPHPLIYDVFKNTINRLDATIVRCVVSDLIEDIFYGLIVLNTMKKRVVIDAQPMDALALALSARAPIFVEKHVLDCAGEQLI